MASCGEDIIPAVAQDAETGEVLIVGYANQLALDTAQKEQWQPLEYSRNELWIKGKTSGDFLEIVEICINCEQNSILYRVIPKGKGACHTKDQSGRSRSGCYYRTIIKNSKLEFREGKV